MIRARSRSAVTPLLAHAAVFGGLVVAIGSGGCGKDGSVVGGACGSGYTQCGTECVDLSTDPQNCGACGRACAAGAACSGGVCAGSAVTGGGDAQGGGPGTDGGTPGDSASDASTDVIETGDSTTDSPAADGPVSQDGSPSPSDGASTDGATMDGTSSDAPSGDSGLGSQGDGSTDDGSSADAGPGDDGCDPPFNTAEHCGDCVTSCSGATPICSPTDDGGDPECAAQCDVPYVPCGALCIDPTRDPNNCGGCGKVCASNLCSDSICAGSTPGEIIVIGHDYFGVSNGTAEAQVLANAVLLPTANPLRILSFEEYASATAVSHVKSIIMIAAAAQARTVSITISTDDTDIPARLTRRNFDLLLVYDQATASAQTLSTIGGSWTTALSNYLSVGGTVIALDGNEGLGQMPSLVTQAGLINVSSHTTIAYRTPLTVASPNDSVATAVLNPYGALTDTVELSTDPPSSSVAYVVVNGSDNMPVVVHKTVR